MAKLLPLLLLAALLAGCADAPADGGDAQPLTAQEAQTLFASAASDLPDRYGMTMQAENATTTLMEADAAYDEPAQTSFLQLRMDPSLLESGGEAVMFTGSGEITLYSTPQGTAVMFDEETVMVGPPGDELEQMAPDQEGLDTLSDPQDFFGEMEESGFTVVSTSADTVRGKPATKVEATVNESGTLTPVTVWLFQDPARIARLVTTTPGEGEDDPFAGATLTMDMLYDDEVEVQPSAGLTRAIGLRYTSSAPAYGFGGGSEGEDLVWTFEVDGGIPLAEIELQMDDATLLKLSDKTAESDGVSATYTDADDDGQVSAGDTLRVAGADGRTLQLHDTVTGLHVVPGAGLLLALVGLAGAAFALRRR